MSESYAERASREGPLPKADDDSELVGEENKSAADKNNDGVAQEHGADYVTLPSPGAGAFPVPTATGTEEDEGSPADQEAER
jgi:hypothetical protein